nr:hypothetical protein [Ferroglobus placidus]
MKSKYYMGSLTFIFGIIVVFAGIIFAISVKLTRYSEPYQIKLTYGLVGFGFAVALFGLNQMVKRRIQYSSYVVISGLLLCIFGLLEFIFFFPQNWRYPYVSYVVFPYVIGSALLIGNAFANSILNLIEGKPVIETKQLTEEEIEREVEKVISESMDKIVKLSESDLKFKDIKIDGFKPSRSFFERKEIVVEKDDIEEAEILKRIITNKVEVEDREIDENSKLLRETMREKEKSKDKKSRLFRWW